MAEMETERCKNITLAPSFPFCPGKTSSHNASKSSAHQPCIDDEVNAAQADTESRRWSDSTPIYAPASPANCLQRKWKKFPCVFLLVSFYFDIYVCRASSVAVPVIIIMCQVGLRRWVYLYIIFEPGLFRFFFYYLFFPIKNPLMSPQPLLLN